MRTPESTGDNNSLRRGGGGRREAALRSAGRGLRKPLAPALAAVDADAARVSHELEHLGAKRTEAVMSGRFQRFLKAF